MDIEEVEPLRIEGFFFETFEACAERTVFREVAHQMQHEPAVITHR
jgi:hypothetical protein